MPRLLSSPSVLIEGASVRSLDACDFYFQAGDPCAEIDWVFFQGNQLANRWLLDPNFSKSNSFFTIAETGFGTGLNFFYTLKKWEESRQALSVQESNIQLHYISLESSPLSRNDLKAVYSAFPEFSLYTDYFLDHLPPAWEGCHRLHFEKEGVVLTLLYGNGLEALKQHSFIADAWYLDGFTPSRNSDFWSAEIMQAIANHSKPGTSLATFTAASFVRRSLGEVGFDIQKKPGYNKRDMLVGKMKENSPPHIQNLNQKDHRKKIAIIGAGYAGIFLAHRLALYGADVFLFDEEGIVSGASKNHAHLVYMKPHRSLSSFNDIYEHALSYAAQFYFKFGQQKKSGFTPTGVLHLLKEKDEENWNLETLTRLWPKNWLSKIEKEQLTSFCGLPLRKTALYMPQAGVIQPKIFAETLLKDMELKGKKITQCMGHQYIQSSYHDAEQYPWEIVFEEKKTQVNTTHRFDTIVFATGSSSMHLLKEKGNGPHPKLDPNKPSHWRYPLRPVAGQSSFLLESTQSLTAELKVPLCSDIYITTMIDGRQSFGSSFHPDQESKGLNQQDHFENSQKLADCLELDEQQSLDLQSEIEGGYAATRMQTTDYLPLVGAIFPEDAPEQYIFTALGAKGTLLSPLLAEVLACDILKQPKPLGDTLIALLCPDRFRQRQVKKAGS